MNGHTFLIVVSANRLLPGASALMQVTQKRYGIWRIGLHHPRLSLLILFAVGIQAPAEPTSQQMHDYLKKTQLLPNHFNSRRDSTRAAVAMFLMYNQQLIKKKW